MWILCVCESLEEWCGDSGDDDYNIQQLHRCTYTHAGIVKQPLNFELLSAYLIIVILSGLMSHWVDASLVKNKMK